MTQEWTVGLIVLAAAVYALWYLLPAGLRRRLSRVHPALGEKRACGACNNCGGCDDPPAAKSGGVQPVRWLPGSTDRHHPD
jgi:hypothetical protein